MNALEFSEADQYLQAQVLALQTMVVTTCSAPAGSATWKAQTLQALQTLRTTAPSDLWTPGAEVGLAAMESWLRDVFPLPHDHGSSS